jgi:hypothetical protein
LVLGVWWRTEEEGGRGGKSRRRSSGGDARGTVDEVAGKGIVMRLPERP